MFFSFDTEIVCVFGWEAGIARVIWDVVGALLILDVTGIVETFATALALAAACKSIAVGGGWGAVGSLAVV